MNQHLLARICACFPIRIRQGGASVVSWAMGMVMMVSFWSSEAMAQAGAAGALRPPKAEETEASPKYVIFLIAVLLTGGVVFAATLKSKRTHQG